MPGQVFLCLKPVQSQLTWTWVFLSPDRDQWGVPRGGSVTAPVQVGAELNPPPPLRPGRLLPAHAAQASDGCHVVCFAGDSRSQRRHGLPVSVRER